MNITVMGTGYVGLVSGVCFADMGNEVVCVDIDKKKVARLNKGEATIYEPGLQDLLERNLDIGRLKFTTDVKEGVESSDVIFICVGTPEAEDGSADLSAIIKVSESIGKYMDSDKVIVIKSTVPVGTNDRVKKAISRTSSGKYSFDIASNPEFLREGQAVRDFQTPDRIILGVENGKSREVLERLYSHMARANKPIMFTSPESAQIIKYASNAMLASRISFMNELSHLCDAVGADIKEVAKGMGLDSRIGSRFLQAGAGYGGSCFPKDVKALASTLEQHGKSATLMKSIDEVNERQKKSIVPRIESALKGISGKKIAVWGLSFKPRTDDIREASSLVIIKHLLSEGATVSAFDPEAMDNFDKEVEGVEFAKTAYAALKDADALILVTEWDEFREPDWEKIKEMMKNPFIFDGRNIYDPKHLKSLGFEYVGVGR